MKMSKWIIRETEERNKMGEGINIVLKDGEPVLIGENYLISCLFVRKHANDGDTVREEYVEGEPLVVEIPLQRFLFETSWVDEDQ